MSSLTWNHGDYEFGNEYRPHWVAAKLPLATGRNAVNSRQLSTAAENCTFMAIENCTLS
jgi:hypothetical protein